MVCHKPDIGIILDNSASVQEATFRSVRVNRPHWESVMSAYFRRRRGAMESHGSALERFIAGIDRVEDAGIGCKRLVPYTVQTVDGEEVRIDNDPPLVIPTAMLLDMAAKLIAAAGKPVMVEEGGKIVLMN